MRRALQMPVAPPPAARRGLTACRRSAVRRGLVAAGAAAVLLLAAAPVGAQTPPEPQPAPGTPFGPVTPAAPPEQPSETEPVQVGRPEEDGLEGFQLLLMLGIAIALIGGVVVMIVRDGRTKRAGAAKKQKRSGATGRTPGSHAPRPKPSGRPPGGPPPPPRKKRAQARAKARRR